MASAGRVITSSDDSGDSGEEDIMIVDKSSKKRPAAGKFLL